MVKPNATGTDAIITARWDYDVYGKVRTQTGSTSNSFRYVGGSCGHPTDDETGLIYMRARYYDPGVGRFVGEDPKADGNNWYSYANGSPTGYIDDAGTTPKQVLGAYLMLFGFMLLVASSGNPAAMAQVASFFAGLGMVVDTAIQFGKIGLEFVGMLIAKELSAKSLLSSELMLLKSMRDTLVSSGVLMTMIPGGVRLGIAVLGTATMAVGALMLFEP